jgi:flagellar biosynthesis protein FliR
MLATWPDKLPTLLMVLGRCAGFVLALPVLGSRQVPLKVRIALVLVLTLALALAIRTPAAVPIDLLFGLRLAGELLFGLAMGFLVTLTLSAVQLAGELMDCSIGLGFSQLVDPDTEEGTSLLAQVQLVLATLLFLAVDGHLTALRTLGESYAVLAPGLALITAGAARGFLSLGTLLFATGVKIAAPVLVSMLVINMLEGVVTRTVPQINILVAGFPIRILAGLVIVALSMAAFVTVTHQIIEAQPGLLAGFIAEVVKG